MRKTIALVCFYFLTPALLLAQAQDNTDARFKAMEERISALEAEIRTLKANPSAAATAQPGTAPASPATTAQNPTAAVPPVAPPENPPTGAQAVAEPAAPTAEATPPVTQAATIEATPALPGETSGQLPVYGGASASAKALNPDISVIGDFLGSAGKNPTRPVPGIEMHESEVGFQAIVDPYARADFFISFGEQGVNLEEGFLTFTSLPGGLVAKVGKMRSAFGKVNTLHNHVLPWTDRPMVTDNLVGGEDGINDAGFSLTRILPAPKNIFLEGTAQIFRGDSSDVFRVNRKKDVSLVGHLRTYRDITDDTNIDLGVSYARGHNDAGADFSSNAFRTQLYGMDATVRWKPLRRSIYHSFVGRTELIWSNREQPLSVQRAFGMYGSLDYQLGRRWFVGGRIDRSDRARDASLTDKGASAILTCWPSEFSQIRGQYRFARYADGREGNELRFQFQFSLGAHGAHPF